MAAVLLGAAAGAGPLRLSVRSGTPQTAHAWAAGSANTYETTFDEPLVVAVSPKDTDARIRFRCVTSGCTFPPQTQPDEVDRVDGSAFDSTPSNGVASIKLVIRTLTPQAVTVVAQPAADPHAPSVRFTLIAR